LLINGRTIHSLFKIPVPKKNDIINAPSPPMNTKQKNKCKMRLKNAQVILIDEVSMMTTIMLHHIHSRLCEIHENNLPFGGLPVIIMGDMYQLSPTMGDSMYKTVFKEPTPTQISLPEYCGSLLFRKFRMFTFSEQMRAADDITHTNFINQIRDTSCSEPVNRSLVDHFKILTANDIENDASWADAPIVVTGNKERHALNLKQAQKFALKHGLPVLMWRKELCGSVATQLPEETIEQLYESNPQLTGIFVEGAPCNLSTLNINPDKGLANGTPGIMHSLCLGSDTEPNIYRQRIDNAIPGQIVVIPIPYAINFKMILPDMDRTTLPNWPASETLVPGQYDETGNLIAGTKDIVVPIFIDRAGQPIKYGKECIYYKEHTVDLAFAITFHKIQGRTVGKIILDLNLRPGTIHGIPTLDLFGFYVGLSRVSNSENMRILPLHPCSTFKYLTDFRRPNEFSLWLEGFDVITGEWTDPRPSPAHQGEVDCR
jgi:hypothetical protein